MRGSADPNDRVVQISKLFAYLLIIALLVFWIFKEGTNDSPSYWITLKVLGYRSKYVEHRAEVLVGKDVLYLSKTIECIPYNTAEIGALKQLHFAPSSQSISHVLADGTGLLLILPDLCYSPVDKEITDLHPVLGRVDNVEAPKKIQIFIVPDAALRKANMRLLRYSANISDDAGRSTRDEDFGEWQATSKEYFHYKNVLDNVIGVFGWLATADDLKQVEGDALPNGNQSRDVAIERNAIDATLDNLFPDRFDRVYGALYGASNVPAISGNATALTSERRLVPFELINGRFTPSFQDIGSLIFRVEPLALAGKNLSAVELARELSRKSANLLFADDELLSTSTNTPESHVASVRHPLISFSVMKRK
ncbi:hypothetical protein [Dongia sp.]|jgi:hypothetical protein|uniref:hypothetical protein n=1 Tax=Dongia sp. TaxID=1977262 RepID=UPI0035B363BF